MLASTAPLQATVLYQAGGLADAGRGAFQLACFLQCQSESREVALVACLVGASSRVAVARRRRCLLL